MKNLTRNFYLIGAGITAIYLLIIWAKVPDTICVHWATIVNGDCNRETSKLELLVFPILSFLLIFIPRNKAKEATYFTYFGPLFIFIFIELLFLQILYYNHIFFYPLWFVIAIVVFMIVWIIQIMNQPIHNR